MKRIDTRSENKTNLGEDERNTKKYFINQALERQLKSLKGKNVKELAEFICLHLPKQKNIAQESDLLAKSLRTVRDISLWCDAIETAIKLTKHPKTKARLLLSHYIMGSSDQSRRREMEKVEKELLKLSQEIKYNMIGILYYVLDVNISWKRYIGIQRTLGLLVRIYNRHGSSDHPIRISYLAYFDTRKISARVLQVYLNACHKFYRETKESY